MIGTFEIERCGIVETRDCFEEHSWLGFRNILQTEGRLFLDGLLTWHYSCECHGKDVWTNSCLLITCQVVMDAKVPGCLGRALIRVPEDCQLKNTTWISGFMLWWDTVDGGLTNIDSSDYSFAIQCLLWKTLAMPLLSYTSCLAVCVVQYYYVHQHCAFHSHLITHSRECTGVTTSLYVSF